MNDLACRDIEDLLIAYAADALEDDERCAVASHLAECRNHDAELNAVRRDFEQLGVSTGPTEPPPSLRAGLLDAFDREVAGNVAPAAVAAPDRSAQRRQPRRFWATPSLGYALAAVLAVVAIGLGAWGLSRGGGNGIQVSSATQGSASMRVTYINDEKLAVLDVDLPRLAQGKVYQAWYQAGGSTGMASLGLLDGNDGRTAFSVDLSDSKAVAVSVEPDGGSPAPTSAPVVVAALN